MNEFTFPTLRPFTLVLDLGSMKQAVTITGVQDHWQGAIERAFTFLPQASPRLCGGKLMLTSPRSHRTYLVNQRTCDCESCKAAQALHRAPVPCWPRAAACLVRLHWDLLKPLGRCAVCHGPIIDSVTPDGERVGCCLVCAYTYWPDVFEDLLPWSLAQRERATA